MPYSVWSAWRSPATPSARAVPSATWLFWITKMTGRRWTAARVTPSWNSPVRVAPSPFQVMATLFRPRILNPSAIPVKTGVSAATMEIGGMIPFAGSPVWRSRPRVIVSAVPR